MALWGERPMVCGTREPSEPKRRRRCALPPHSTGQRRSRHFFAAKSAKKLSALTIRNRDEKREVECADRVATRREPQAVWEASEVPYLPAPRTARQVETQYGRRPQPVAEPRSFGIRTNDAGVCV